MAEQVVIQNHLDFDISTAKKSKDGFGATQTVSCSRLVLVILSGMPTAPYLGNSLKREIQDKATLWKWAKRNMQKYIIGSLNSSLNKISLDAK